MIRVIGFCVASFLLNLSVSTVASALQQSPDVIAKGPSTNPSPALRSKEMPVNIVPDTFLVIIRDTSFMQINTRLKAAAERLKEKTSGIEEYVKANNFNSDYCFMVDM